MNKLILLVLLLLSSASSLAQEAATFVFAKIADPVLPIERGTKYEDPLDAALKSSGLGEVTGGGTMQAKDKTIEWVGLDIELVGLGRGIPFLCKKLIELGAPQGSTLEYKVGGKKTVTAIGSGACK